MSKTLSNVIGFFRSGWKFVALTTLALSLVLITLLLLLPPLYTRDVTITVTPTLTDLQRRLGQQEPISDRQIGNATATFLREGKEFDDEILVDPVYRQSTGLIEVHMESENETLMQTMDSRLVELLETTYQRNYERDLTSATETALQALDSEVLAGKGALADIEREIEGTSSSADPGTRDDLERLEEGRAAAAANLDALEERKSYLAGALEDVSSISDEAVTVSLVDETPVRSQGTRGPAIAATLLLSFVVAVAGALRLGHPRGK